MISICNDKFKCFRTMVIVGLVQMTTVFSYAKTNIAVSKEKYENITPVCPLIGEALELGNQIVWEKFETEDVKFYIIQRSNDGQHFKPIAMVQKLDDQKRYSFLDKNSGNKKWFYRIVKVNAHGEGYFTESIFLK